jgi:hypothetical protein
MNRVVAFLLARILIAKAIPLWRDARERLDKPPLRMA